MQGAVRLPHPVEEGCRQHADTVLFDGAQVVDALGRIDAAQANHADAMRIDGRPSLAACRALPGGRPAQAGNRGGPQRATPRQETRPLPTTRPLKSNGNEPRRPFGPLADSRELLL